MGINSPAVSRPLDAAFAAHRSETAPSPSPSQDGTSSAKADNTSNSTNSTNTNSGVAATHNGNGTASGRVGAEPAVLNLEQKLLDEVNALRQQNASVGQVNQLLHSEVTRMTAEVAHMKKDLKAAAELKQQLANSTEQLNAVNQHVCDSNKKHDAELEQGKHRIHDLER